MVINQLAHQPFFVVASVAAFVLEVLPGTIPGPDRYEVCFRLLFLQPINNTLRLQLLEIYVRRKYESC